jgi:hypothetical protein
MTDLKDFKFDDWSVVYGTPMQYVDVSNQVIFFEGNQVRIRLTLGDLGVGLGVGEGNWDDGD